MQTTTDKKIVILGMSNNPERYSFMAYNSLLNHGYNKLIGVTPKYIELDGIEIVDHLDKVESVDTLTLYAGPKITTPLIDAILKLNPKRIIMNPGTENPKLKTKAEAQGIEVTLGCTLVMLSTNQF